MKEPTEEQIKENERHETVQKINKMLEGTGLHLCWYTKNNQVIEYSLADKHGDEVDILQVVKYG